MLKNNIKFYLNTKFVIIYVLFLIVIVFVVLFVNYLYFKQKIIKEGIRRTDYFYNEIIKNDSILLKEFIYKENDILYASKKIADWDYSVGIDDFIKLIDKQKHKYGKVSKFFIKESKYKCEIFSDWYAIQFINIRTIVDYEKYKVEELLCFGYKNNIKQLKLLGYSTEVIVKK